MLSVNKAESQADKIELLDTNDETAEEVGKFYADIYSTLIKESSMPVDHARDIVVAIVTTP